MRKLLNVVLTVIGLMFLSGSVAAANDNSNSSYSIVTDATERVEGILTTIVNPIHYTKELDCLARNIFYESGSEPREGKIAVGMVTINRSQDDRFPNTICGVVKQRTVTSVPKQVSTTTMVKTGWFNKPEKHVETKTVWNQLTVCQFSWSCMKVQTPKENDPRWVESKQVAQELLTGGYDDYRPKYGNLEYFHATFIHPAWKGLKRMARIGGHIFYASND